MRSKRTREEFECAAKEAYSIAGMCRILGVKPVKYDHTHSIRQLMTNIMTLDKRWIRAETKFEAACRISGVDPGTILRHANRIRLIIVELVGKLEYLINLLGESHDKK